MNKTWVLVADSEKARLFEFERLHDPWDETACFVNADAPQGPASERPPRVQESVGGARHAIEARTDPKDKAAARFAAALATALRTAHDQQRFQSLVVAAAPRFLGALHREMDKSLQQCVSREIRRNLTTLDSAGVRDYLLD
ncbi:host attachment protein [Frateuria soli]|uniref:host attachment protein n=1 Tax=Frateuria soli TaxID=1542730 RepID=UPI001E3FF750|nr:host attachment protein [Frateuria soli]UGB39604.1 host attachment protein [Frateuria soli]